MTEPLFQDNLAGSGDRPAPGLSLSEVVDRLLDRGVVLRGELWLTVADVDLAFVGLDLLIASPDTVARGAPPGPSPTPSSSPSMSVAGAE